MGKAGTLTIDVNAGTAQFIVDMDRANAKLRQFGSGAEQAGHGVVSSMQSSSAAIRLLENPLGNNIRAVERFITLLPGVSSLLQAAFPIVGALAFGSILAKMGGEAVAFFQKIQQAPERIAGAFRELNNPLKLTNDELALANDRLRNDIAKLEGKPQNGLAVALDEARVFADKLGESLDKDLGSLNKLLQQNEIGFFKSILAGVRTDDLRKELGGATGSGGFRGQINQISDTGSAKIDAAKTRKEADAARAEMAANLTAAYDAEIGMLSARLDSAKAKQAENDALKKIRGTMPWSLRTASHDESTNIEETQDTLRNLKRERSFVGQSNTNQTLTEKKTTLTDAKANAKAYDEALKQGYDQMLAEAEASDALLASEKLAFRENELREIQQDGKKHVDLVRELHLQIAALEQEDFKAGEAARDKEEKEQQAFNEKMAADKTAWAQKGYKAVEEQNNFYGDPNKDLRGDEIPDLLKRKPEDLTGVVGDEARLNKAGFPGASRQEGAIADQQKGLAAMVGMNAPIGQQLELREKILEAQIALGIEEDKDVSKQQLELDILKARQTLMQWKNIGIATGEAEIINSLMQLPQLIGSSLASGIFTHQHGRNAGYEITHGIGQSLKGTGEQLTSKLITDGLQKLAEKAIEQLGLQTAFNALFPTVQTGQTTAIVGAITASATAIVGAVSASGAAGTAGGAAGAAGGIAGAAGSGVSAAATGMMGPLISAAGGIIGGVISGVMSLIGDNRIVKAVDGTTAAVLSLRGNLGTTSSTPNGLTSSTSSTTSSTPSGMGFMSGLMTRLFGSGALDVNVVSISPIAFGAGIFHLFGFADGGPVTHDMVAQVHKGEHVLNADQVAGRAPLPGFLRGAQFPSTGDYMAAGGSVVTPRDGDSFGGNHTFHIYETSNARETAAQIKRHLTTMLPSLSKYAR